MIKIKIPPQRHETANLPDYEKTRREFSWTDAEKMFFPGTSKTGNIIAHSVDKWGKHPDRRDHPAIIFESREYGKTWTYAQLRDISCRWAAMLAEHGFVAGDRLMVFAPPCPETYFAIAACARLGVVFCPVFSTSTINEIDDRLAGINPRGVLTTPDLAEKLSPEYSGSLAAVFLQKGPAPGLFPNEVLVQEAASQMSAETVITRLSKDSPLYMIFTSGSTRPPKGIVHSQKDITGIYATAQWVLDVKPDTILWTDADPSWVTGTVYGAYAPWLFGITSFVAGDCFSASSLYRLLEKHRVSVWYTTPGVLAGLMDEGEDLPGRYDLSSLVHIATTGAPLVPETIYWCRKHLNSIPHDTWWMTETGMICIANIPAADIKPGSAGRPLPGIEAAIVDEYGECMPPMSIGELALKPGWPAMMTGIFNDKDRYGTYFSDKGWFLTGDVGIIDDDGYCYHHGRNDDLIKTGDNKLIGPFEIEQLLCMHPAVAESAVIAKATGEGKPGSCIKAFIILCRDYRPSLRLAYEIKTFLKQSIADDLMAEEIEFVESLPRTQSGKLLRRVLRARELGLPGGEPKQMKD